MKLVLPFPHTALHPFARLRGWHRVFVSVIIGDAVTLWARSPRCETGLLSGLPISWMSLADRAGARCRPSGRIVSVNAAS